ncbi:MAG: hypothetical protein HXY43_24780 [Fischerella sp.]|jgi:hypothetical protein|uniref:hypothetical protein n=1 Tax=Fischerella sp. TaxID=1191 RepID=UPI0018551070|nr:hypothetical protein [Fischerella sp.]NWF62371.1 hypothetical protein [Fischerella sp.]
METLIAEIVRKLQSLSEIKVLEVLDFVDFLAWDKKQLVSRPLSNDLLQENEEFESIADRLADEFQMYVGATTPALSDYAVSRAGIYEEHP